MEYSAASEEEIRDRAVESLKRKRALRTQIGMWLLISALLIAIWALTGADFFWPVFPIAGWGIGLLALAGSISAPVRRPISLAHSARACDRLRR